MIVIDRKVPWMLELAWLVAWLAELGHERPAIIAIIIIREYLHSMIPGISDEQETSMMVERQARRDIELAISIAMLLGADRELDSSISIKSIVSHLFQTELSLPCSDEEIFSQPPQTSRASQEIETHTQLQRDDERRKEQHHQQAVSLSLTTTLTHTNPITNPKPISLILSFRVDWCSLVSQAMLFINMRAYIKPRDNDDNHDDDEAHQRNEKISNKSSFGIIDIAEHSSTSDRIIVIVETACLIDDGAYRWRCGRHANVVSASH